MTKFTLHSEYYNHEKTDGEFVINDNGQPLIATNSYEDAKLVNDLLNEQHEQIQELIQSSKEFEEDCQSTFNAMSRKQDDLYRKNFKLKEENEQLKEENEWLKSIHFANDVLKENKELKSFIKELTSNDGKIWLMNGYVYKTDKILKGDVE